MLMALENISYFLVKATFTRTTREAVISQVTLDVASDNSRGNRRAVEVEQVKIRVIFSPSSSALLLSQISVLFYNVPSDNIRPLSLEFLFDVEGS